MYALLRGSPLAFPNRRPGFDPSHPAARNPRFSAVAVTGGGAIDLLNGKKGTVTSGSAGIGQFGPQIGFTNGGSGGVTWTGGPALAETATTLAALFVSTGTTSNGQLVTNNDIGAYNAGVNITVIGQTIYIETPPNYTGTNLPNLVTNVPYFIAVSLAGGVYTAILVRLDTGAVYTDSGSATISGTADNGSFTLGAANNGSGSCAANVIAGMFSGCFLSLPQLKTWAADLGAFWYPRGPLETLDWLGAASGGGGSTVALLARSGTMGRGRAAAYGNLALAGRTGGSAFGRPGVAGTASIAARSTGAGGGRAGAAVIAALKAIGAGSAKARGALAGLLPLSARTALQSKSRATLGAVSNLVSLSASGAVATKARGVLSGTVPLSARAASPSKSRAAIGAVSNLVAFSSIGAAVAKAQAALVVAYTRPVDPRFISTPHSRSPSRAAMRSQNVTPPARNLVTRSRNGMPQGRDFSPLDSNETVNDTFDFGPWLSMGVTITSVTGVTCSAYLGTDGNAPSRLVGSASIVASPSTGGPSAAVLQQIGNNPVAGVTYRLDATVITSDGQTLNLWAHQLCQAPF